MQGNVSSKFLQLELGCSMRAFCTVSAPLEVCAPPSRPLLPGARFLALRLLGIPQPRTLYFLVEAKSRVREVYTQTCLHFAKQGMLDTELFGLAVLIDGEYLFADPESKLSKYGPKSWRSSHTHGLDANGRPLLELHFRVQFYIESPLMLRDETSRHNYYLQLKANAICREFPKECPEQILILLGGLALQADFGDCPDDMNTEYFRLEDYIPHHMRSSWGSTALQSCHREYRGMSRADAETNYIREACVLQEALNAHVFRMKLSKNEIGAGSVWFIVYAKGIKVYGDDFQPTTFLWPNISKLSFERKKFEIRYGDKKTILYSASDDKNKNLFSLCKDTHQFSMKTATRLSEAIRREEEESSCLHSCYMYSRSLNLPYKNKGDQRISVISSTSSNTTSGIVSDRVHSEDELEIMINTPPAVPVAAPSTESLALAHLLDNPSVSRQTSSVGKVSLCEVHESVAALSIHSNSRSTTSEPLVEHKHDCGVKDPTDTDSPKSQHNIGSQCSSTCSTIVVTSESTTLPSIPTESTQTRRRISATSSLELGFSHTAQNSTLSETVNTSIDLNYASNHAEEEETMSGVYTLAHQAPTETSGVYTMSNSELTGQSSEIAESESHESSYYGSFQPKSDIDTESEATRDSVDGNFRKRMDSDARDFRMRSDSNVSTSGSFRGDGSDPSDKKHVLLSAEELTDLIVGRGTYPSRKTVSDTLDSDCDYVTLPLPLDGESYLQGNQDTAPTEDEYEDELLPANPPIPPIRVDSNSHRSFPILPPPYNARHETTGICGPPVKRKDDCPAIPLRDPPPYPQQPNRVPQPTPTQPPSVVSSEEAAARFITTRPQINILKAHTSVIGENPKPSFAAPTVANVQQSHMPIPTTIGIPIVPYHNIPVQHKNISYPYPDGKPKPPRTCVLLPVIKPRQYLPPPPPTLPRQPPPPPPHQLATVYSSQLARSQIELYQQQLYSDVDYVIYPLQDPAVSQQEYLDAKQGSILAAMAQNPPPAPYLAYHTGSHHGTWDSCKGHAIYRSTPYLSMAYSTHSRYASTQNLSDTYVQLPGTYSPLYSPSVASLCSSYEPPPPLRPRPLPHSVIFSRSKSDDNILKSVETVPKVRRLPPPPPPPYDYKKPVKPSNMMTPLNKPLPIPPVPSKQTTLSHQQTTAATIAELTQAYYRSQNINTTPVSPTNQNSSSPTTTPTTTAPANTIDINILREKSKNMDLPLISALCNDRSLLKQTKAFVMPKHPRLTINQCDMSPKHGKYPVSGLSTTQLAKPRKTSIGHRHPNDKLPDIPMQTAEGNNYVMDPTPTAIKHKSYHSQPNL